MSTTDLRPTHPEQREPEAPLTPKTEPKPKIDLSVTQVAGGALAAMTAAFLGSRLSVAGTVVGAALASVVAAVASNLYTASLQTTREKVRTAFRGRDGGSPAPVPDESADDTFTWSDGQPAGSTTPTPPQPKRQLRWPSVVLGAVAAFALAFAVLTGLELASGQSLSGGNGTTITQVTEHQPAADPTPEPSSGASGSPTPKASDSPTAEPSATASSEPTATPSTTEPTPTETPSATATPSSESSATAAPGTGDEQGAAAPGADQGSG